MLYTVTRGGWNEEWEDVIYGTKRRWIIIYGVPARWMDRWVGVSILMLDSRLCQLGGIRNANSELNHNNNCNIRDPVWVS